MEWLWEGWASPNLLAMVSCRTRGSTDFSSLLVVVLFVFVFFLAVFRIALATPATRLPNQGSDDMSRRSKLFDLTNDGWAGGSALVVVVDLRSKHAPLATTFTHRPQSICMRIGRPLA